MKKRITVYEYDDYDDYGPPLGEGNLKEAITFLQKKFDEVPPEYQDIAEIYIASHDCIDVEIFYTREETTEEAAERSRRQWEVQELRKKQELELLADLKAKYEG